MSKQYFLIVLIIVIPLFLSGQTFKVGQDAEDIKRILKLMDTNNDIKLKLEGDQIAEIKQCFSEEYVDELKITVDFCKRYVMKDGKLDYILTQYAGLSIRDLKALYEINYSENKSSGFYLSDDFKYSSKLYVDEKGDRLP